MPTKKPIQIAETAHTHQEDRRKTVSPTDFESLRNASRIEAESMLQEISNRPISPNANPGMLTAMSVATVVQQNQYIIKLLEVVISNRE